MNDVIIPAHMMIFVILYLKIENVATTKPPQVLEPTAKCSYWLLHSSNFPLIKNNRFLCQEVKCTNKNTKTKQNITTVQWGVKSDLFMTDIKKNNKICS